MPPPAAGFFSVSLAQLKQFVNGPTEVVISIVVANEILKHLTDKTRSAKDGLEAAYKKAVDFGLRKHEEAIFDEPAPDPRALAKKRLEQFLADIDAHLVSVDDVSMRDLLRKYFASAPPFSTLNKKKNEFPDAIALMSLEAWAMANDKNILAVSGDKDWMAYAEKSERIEVVPHLSDALAMLQEHAEEAEAIVQKMLAGMQTGQREEMKAQFVKRLGDEVPSLEVYAEADSNYYVESDEVQLAFLDYALLGDEESYDYTAVQAGPRKIAARIGLKLKVRAQASFSLSVHDSIDDDYVPMGSANAEIEETIEVSVLVTFQGDFNSNDVEISELEVVEGPSSIDFGFVVPDYHDDYDDYADDP
jgi:intracellular sulfur oxidation DsrE/DsrF family protein